MTKNSQKMKRICLLVLCSIITVCAYSQSNVVKFKIDETDSRFKLNDGSFEDWKPYNSLNKAMEMTITLDATNKVLIFTSKYKDQGMNTHVYKIAKSTYDDTKKDIGYTFLDMMLTADTGDNVHWVLITDNGKYSIITVNDTYEEKYILTRTE